MDTGFFVPGFIVKNQLFVAVSGYIWDSCDYIDKSYGNLPDSKKSFFAASMDYYFVWNHRGNLETGEKKNRCAGRMKMYYLKIYRRFIITYLKGKMEYHGALALELIANTILIGVYFAGFYVIFSNFNNIAGWSPFEVVFLFTSNWFSYSLSSFLFWSPMKDMGELIRSGSFDLYLTRPVGPLIFLVLQQFQYTFLPRLFFAIAFLSYSIGNLEINWTFRKIAYYGVCMGAACVIFSGIIIITGAISFWIVKGEGVVTLITNNDYGVKNFCDWPMEIYPKGIQFLLTCIIPFGFTGYYPVAFLLGKSLPCQWLAYISPLIALVIAGLAGVIWQKGLKRYGSAG